jgi:hypothetical protein
MVLQGDLVLVELTARNLFEQLAGELPRIDKYRVAG